jgi:hypothetical protein
MEGEGFAEPAPASRTQMTPPTDDRKPWAVLAYTVADHKGSGDSLDASLKQELVAICDAADFAAMGVAAQVDFKRTPGVFRGSLTVTPAPGPRTPPERAEDHPLWRRLLGTVERSVLRVAPETRELNVATGGVLEQFLHYGRGECDAERYFLFFYGHASGPMGLFYDSEPGRREATTLRLADLATSLDCADGRVAIVLFRDCFMNTLETAYQLRHVAEYMIASQAEAPIAGVWPWIGFLSALMPSASSADVARGVALQLGYFLDDPANRGRFADVPYSLIDLGEADAVAKPLRALARALQEARGDARRRAACAEALEAARIGRPSDPAAPGDPALLDVLTMCDHLRALRRDPVTEPASVLGNLVRDRLVRWHHSQRGAHRGISLYYKPATASARDASYIEAPTEEAAAADALAYEQLALSRATGWDAIALNPLEVE